MLDHLRDRNAFIGVIAILMGILLLVGSGCSTTTRHLRGWLSSLEPAQCPYMTRTHRRSGRAFRSLPSSAPVIAREPWSASSAPRIHR